MRLLLFLLLILMGFSAFGQRTIHGKVLSMGDNNLVSNFRLETGRKQYTVTDSTGSFFVSTTKKRIKISFPYTITQSKDTIIIFSDTSINVELFTYLTWDSTQAKYDIEHHDMKLFCCFGFLVLAPTQKDKDFEKEYKVKYYIMGDAPPAPIRKLQTYNNTIGKYLDEKYGPEWRKKTKAYL